jgi:hypothetical protein
LLPLLLTGPEALGQVRRASRFISLGTPWHLIEKPADNALGTVVSRPLVGALAVVLALVLVVAFARVVPSEGEDPQPVAARAAFVLAAAWVLAAPYSLPWYDAVVWAPLAVLPGSRLDPLFLIRGAVLAAAYVPGRAVPLPEALHQLMIVKVRSVVAPWTTLAVILLVTAWAWRWPAARHRCPSRPTRPTRAHARWRRAGTGPPG